MDVPTPAHPSRLHLKPFDRIHAGVITKWVTSTEQLRWLAPGTAPPLTSEKVVAWRRAGGHPYLLVRDGQHEPVGYGELNPMRRLPRDLWLGHLIIKPDERGLGLGQVFVRELLLHAFDQLAAERVSLIVFPENTAAIRCYGRAGFETVREEYHHFGASRKMHKLLRLEIHPAQMALAPAG